MVKFGEKLKQLREKSGMTQATLAEHLYVTRQTVSRWECGARYPDLLTTKKIADILNVSIDELVSGEEFQMNIEKEPVLAKPVSNVIQTMLYSIAAAAYLLMSILAIKSLFPDKSLSGTPAGKITLINIAAVSRTLLCFLTVAAGLFFSVKNKLTPRKTGLIMSAHYGIAAVEFILTIVTITDKENGYMSWTGWIDGFLIPFVSFVCIILHFHNGKYKISSIVIYGIAALSVLEILYAIKLSINCLTELSFAVRTISYLGRFSLIALLIYQTNVFSKKIKMGINI